MRKTVAVVITFVLMLAPDLVSLSSAQEYVLDKGDLITITFWQQPDLNTQVRIDAEGKIDLPLVGRITAAGLTPEQLGRKTVDKISIFNKKITQASVAVTEYGSRKIFITGAVVTPGKYTFERIPNLWEAILEAGGPLPSAQLNAVQVIRGGEASGQITEVNLSAAFERGDMSGLPALSPGDNIHVPAAVAPAAEGGTAQGNITYPKNSVYVFGYVATPGIYPYEDDMDVLQAIIRAGGPIFLRGQAGGRQPALDSDLSNVKIIRRGPESPVVYTVDLDNYTKHASPVPLPLRPGDTVFVPARQDYSRFLLSTSLGEVIRGSVAIITSYLLLNQLFNQGGK